jgi:hypothetical protein
VDEGARKTIAKYVEDMHSLLIHGLRPIERQLDEEQMKRHPEALQAVRDFKTTLERQRDEIDRRMHALGTSPTTAVQDAASAVAGVVAGLYNQVRTEAASKSIRDDYTFISHCAIAYLMLHTTAAGLGDDETARLADRGYRDCARMVMDVDRLMPTLVVQELRQDGLSTQDVSGECRRLVSEAWSRQ